MNLNIFYKKWNLNFQKNVLDLDRILSLMQAPDLLLDEL